MEKTKKPLHKQPAFWIPVGLVVALAAISQIPYGLNNVALGEQVWEAIKHKYELSTSDEHEPGEVWRVEDPEDPKYDIPEEEFGVFEGGEKKEWEPMPLPEDELKIDREGENDLQIITHYRDGYRLELPKDLSVSAWELEPDFVDVFDLSNPEDACSAHVFKSDFKTIQESFKISSDYRKELDGFAYNILRNELEKIQDPTITKEAYIEHYENDTFGYQPSILIQGDGVVFGISHNGRDYQSCDVIMRVLKGFKFINES